MWCIVTFASLSRTTIMLAFKSIAISTLKLNHMEPWIDLRYLLFRRKEGEEDTALFTLSVLSSFLFVTHRLCLFIDFVCVVCWFYADLTRLGAAASSLNQISYIEVNKMLVSAKREHKRLLQMLLRFVMNLFSWLFAAFTVVCCIVCCFCYPIRFWQYLLNEVCLSDLFSHHTALSHSSPLPSFRVVCHQMIDLGTMDHRMFFLSFSFFVCLLTLDSVATTSFLPFLFSWPSTISLYLISLCQSNSKLFKLLVWPLTFFWLCWSDTKSQV